MEKNKKNIISLIVLCVSIIALTTSLTYAYFLTTASVNEEEKVTVKSGTLALTFKDDDDTVENIEREWHFGDTIEKELIIENTGTLDTYAKISWDNFVNTYLEGSLSYTLEISEDGTNYTKKIDNENVPQSTSPTTIPMNTIISMPSKTTYRLKLSITLNDLNVDQTEDLNANFATKFTINEDSGKVEIAFYSDDEVLETKTVMYDETINELPTPTKTGYEFLGWFTAPDESGIQIHEDTKNILNTKLYAHWQPKLINITLQAGYGKFDDNTKTKVIQRYVGEPYGTLPLPSGYGQYDSCSDTALGWYYNDVNNIINESTIVTLTEDHTLYAKVSCFKAGTLIYTPKGYTAIEKIKVGDEVYSYNEDTQQIEISKVSKTFAHENIEILYVTLEDGTTIYTTANHPFYNETTKEWKPIGEFKVGEDVMNKDGESIKITAIKETHDKEMVYNLEVEGNHNYFVTESNILVHNKLC